jgi:hypothetical protein
MDQELKQLQLSIIALNEQIKRLDQRIANLESLGGKAGASAAQQRVQPVAQERPAQVSSRQPQSLTSINWKSLEMNIGKYVLQILGIAVFLIGMGFLLKFSIERGWISPLVRVIAGFCVATAAVIGAELLQARLKQWALGCTAGGIVLYYLSTYAAYGLYHLFSDTVALCIFVATTALGAFLATRYNSQLIGVFSLVGGLLVPIFIAPTDPLFTAQYLLVLAGAFMLFVYARTWYVLAIIGFVGLAVYQSFLRDELLLSSYLWFLAFFFAIYNLIPYGYTLIYKPARATWEAVIVAVSGLYVFGYFTAAVVAQNASQRLLDTVTPDNTNLFVGASTVQILEYCCIAFGAIYFIELLIAFIRKVQPVLLGSLFVLTVALWAGVLIAHWSGYTLSIILHGYALLLLVVGLHVRNRFVRRIAYICWIGACIDLLWAWGWYGSGITSLLWNPINAAAGAIIVMFMLGAWLVKRYARVVGQQELVAASDWLQAGAVMTVIYWLHTEIWSYPYGSIALVWFALGLFAAGCLLSSGLYRRFGYGVGLLAGFYSIRALYAYDIMYAFTGYNPWGTSTLMQSKYIVPMHLLFATWTASAVLVVVLFKKYRDRLTVYEQRNGLRLAKLFMALVVYAWARAVLITSFDTPSTDRYARSEQTDVLLAVYYSAYALAMIVIGLFKKETLIRYVGLGLMCLALGKLWMVIMAMPETMHRIIAFILVGTSLTVASFVYQRLSKKVLGS